MIITLEQVQGSVPVTIMGLQGELDASNYQEVIAAARDAYHSGCRYMLVDMSRVNFMSSSGIVALHSVAMLMRGEQLHDLEAGWNVLHAIQHDLDTGIQQRVKLLNPQPKVLLTLEKTAMDTFFEIHMDRQAAIQAFS